ncbi:MAG: BCCT family transporter, partial [Rhodobacteraceae bacterium]
MQEKVGENAAVEPDTEDVAAPDIEPIPAPEGETEIIETDYEIGSHNIAAAINIEYDIHKVVFSVSAGLVILFTFLTMAYRDDVGPLFAALRDFVITNLDWFFLSAGNIFVLLCLFLIVSPLGKIRLGGPEATPDYGYVGWFSMLFAAGMGIGLMFYGVAEPMSHFSAAYGGVTVEDGVRTDWAPLGGAEGDAAAARSLGMAATIFHWGLHPWAIYAVVALALALFAYNKGLPLTLRSAFYPILGERVWGWPGNVIDILAVFATIFGLATSLGVGAEQAAAGLNFLFGTGTSENFLVFLIIFITAMALVSVVAGLDRGVKVLSELNMGLAALLLVFVIAVGPTLQIFTGFFANLGAYAYHLPALSMPFAREDANFSQG